MEVFRLLLTLALRSLVAHRVKSFFVGLLLFFGTFLVVSGSAISRSIERSMEAAITQSIAGHLQIYDSEAPDPLEVFGGMGLGSTDVGEIEAFEDVTAAIGPVDNVAAIVPMGITQVTVFERNDIETVLNGLRDGVREGDRKGIDAMVSRLRRILEGMNADKDTWMAITDEEVAAEQIANLERAENPSFWTAFSADAESWEALEALDWLDSKIAPLATDGRLHYLRVIGTDPGLFEQHFDKFYIVDGQGIEPGQRGFLFSKRTYEQIIKNVVAVQLDEIHEAVVEDGKTIADDEILSLQVIRNARQYRRIVYQLSPDDSDVLAAALAAYLGKQGAIEDLVQDFLTVDDSDIIERHAWFYEHIAPHIQLYEIPVGGTITLRAFTKSGYMRSVNVPVLGTYELRGLEKAGVASASNLTDLVTFRDLYGKMSDADRAELADIRADVGAAEVGRDDAEDFLFGGGGDLVEAVEVDEAPPVQELTLDIARIDPNERYDTVQLREGLVLNAAILLEDRSRLRETQAAVQAAADAAGLRLQVIDWQVAAGITGQFIVVMRLVGAVALFIIFLVALIIINNAMVMATMDRVAEIGTMRAIGAQRTVVVTLFLLETLVLGAVAGGLGALAGIGLVTVLGYVGIPALGEILVMLFAGPRLYPTVDLLDAGFGMAIVTGVAFLSTLYPAILAAGIHPVVAMQGKE